MDENKAEELSKLADTKYKQARVFRKRWFFGTFETNGISALIKSSSVPHHENIAGPACEDHAKCTKRSTKRFLIRCSNNRPGHFVFTRVVLNRQTRHWEANHILINETIDGRYYIKKGRYFNSLEDFVMSRISKGYEPILKEWSETD